MRKDLLITISLGMIKLKISQFLLKYKISHQLIFVTNKLIFKKRSKK